MVSPRSCRCTGHAESTKTDRDEAHRPAERSTRKRDGGGSEGDGVKRRRGGFVRGFSLPTAVSCAAGGSSLGARSALSATAKRTSAPSALALEGPHVTSFLPPLISQ
jgi:hypothetical protein